MDEETYGMIQPSDEGVEGMGLDTAESGGQSRGEPACLIEHDLPCRHCGNNLRGKTSDRACRECGMAVRRSLVSGQLYNCDPAWLRTIARGMAWLGCGISLVFIASPAIYIFAHLIHLPNMFPPLLAARIVALGGGVVSLVGAWMMSAPEVDRQAVSNSKARHLVRWAMLGAIGILVLNLLAMAVDPIFSVNIGAIVAILLFVSCLSLCVYARQIALRFPDYRLAKYTRILMWAMLAVPLLSTLFAILPYFFLAVAVSDFWLFTIMMVNSYGAELMHGIFGIWVIGIAIWYRRVVLRATKVAEQTWASGIAR